MTAHQTLLGRLLLSTLIACSGAAALSAQELPIHILLPPGDEDPVPVKIWLIDLEKDARDFIAAQAPTEGMFRGAPERTRQMTIEAAGYWSPTHAIRTGVDLAPVVFQLLPAAEVKGQLVVEPAETLPAKLQVRFEPAAGSAASEIPRDFAECLVAQDGTFRCSLPAGTLDLRVRAQGFVSHYFWAQVAERGKLRDLGQLRLQRGGSVAGKVEVPGGQTSPEGALVEVAQLQGSHPSTTQDGQRFAAMATSARADSRGFFHLAGLAPGLYSIAATKGTLSAGSYPPLTVHQDAETELTQPLLLQAPATLQVSIHPAVDAWQKPWKLELLSANAAGSSFQPVAQGRTSPEGTWNATRLARDRYLVGVLDSTGARWAFAEVTVAGEQEELALTLDMVPVEGQITLGDEPLAADLWFGGRRGRRSIKMLADAEGHFSGVLPEEGDWPVDLQAHEPRFSRRVREVAVETGENGVAEVTIALQDFVLRGEVVDSRGEPVQARLLLNNLAEGGQPTQDGTGAGGTFTFRGLGPGTYQVQAFASGGTLTSSQVGAEILRSGESPYLTLRLGERRPFTGRVISTFGPVPGAAVEATPLTAGQPSGILLPQAQSNASGVFELDLPPEADTLELTVAAPGYALSVQRLPLQGPPEATVALHRDGGTLDLKLHDGAEISRLWATLRLDLEGVNLPTPTVLRWLNTYRQPPATESTLSIPMLDFGNYQACNGSGSERACASGFLPPGGSLFLDLSQPATP